MVIKVSCEITDGSTMPEGTGAVGRITDGGDPCLRFSGYVLDAISHAAKAKGMGKLSDGGELVISFEGTGETIIISDVEKVFGWIVPPGSRL